jgi:hypothetical protein
MDAAVGIGCSTAADSEGRLDMVEPLALRPGVGDVASVEDERRDRLGRGDAEPPLLSCVERSEAVDERFFRLGVDLRLSSLRELELGMRLGVKCGGWLTPGRAGGSDGDRSEEEENADGEGGG